MAHLGQILTRWRCRRLAARLVNYAEESLPPGDRARVEQHLALCSDCQSTLAALQSIPATIRQAALPADEARWARQRRSIMQAIDRSAPARTTRREWAWRSVLVAATVVLIAALSYRAVRHSGTPLREPLNLDALDADTVVALDDVVDATIPNAVDWTTENLAPRTVAALDDLADEELAALSELFGSEPS